MGDVYADVINWLRAIVPQGVVVTVANNNFQAPPRPYLTLRITPTGQYGDDRTGVDNDGREQYTRFISFTAALQIYGRPGATPTSAPESESIAQTILDNAGNLQLRDQYLGATIAFNQVLSGPQSVDGVIGTQWEPRTIMDLGMSATRDTIFQVGVIETLEISGQINGTTSGAPIELEFTTTV